MYDFGGVVYLCVVVGDFFGLVEYVDLCYFIGVEFVEL